MLVAAKTWQVQADWQISQPESKDVSGCPHYPVRLQWPWAEDITAEGNTSAGNWNLQMKTIFGVRLKIFPFIDDGGPWTLSVHHTLAATTVFTDE